MVTSEQIKQLVEEKRKEKDRFFKSSSGSPIPEHERESFNGLNYFPYDPGYCVPARFYRNHGSDKVVMTTSRGTRQTHTRYGFFEFQLGGKLLRLEAYKAVREGHEHEEESLFVPFRDATSGKEAYGAARYLDVREESSESYVIDFNLAYNPYCAYSEDYVCPLPPSENWLDVPVRAGEKAYHKSH